MTEPLKTSSYEFSEAENRLLTELSRNMYKLGILVLIAGVLFILYLVVSFIDPVPILDVGDTKNITIATLDYLLWGIISVLVIYLSVMVIKLTKPIRLIAQTSGLDISYLMEFVGGLTKMCRLSLWCLSVICVLIALSLVLLILVF